MPTSDAILHHAMLRNCLQAVTPVQAGEVDGMSNDTFEQSKSFCMLLCAFLFLWFLEPKPPVSENTFLEFEIGQVEDMMENGGLAVGVFESLNDSSLLMRRQREDVLHDAASVCDCELK